MEGPVHQDRVIRKVAESFGIVRVGNLVRAQALAAIDRAVGARIVVRRGEFLRPHAMKEGRIRESGPRKISEVAPEEIADGVVAFLELAFAISRESLITAIAREFGYDRTGTYVAAGIGKVIDSLISDGILVDIGGQISLTKV